VQRGHDVILKTIFAATNVTILDVDVRSLAPGVAVAVATMRFAPLKDAAGKDMAEIRSRGSFTMLKRDGLWKIAHFQNTTIDTLAEKIGDPLTWPNGIPPFPAPDGKK
jgi:uncharacterized protein (TIGR02246 family)